MSKTNEFILATAVESADVELPARAGRRIDGVDVLRGLVMVLMALDHSRDFFGPKLPQPGDLEHGSTLLFMTRWVTHFCAPVFVLLAGVSVHLASGLHHENADPSAARAARRRQSWRLLWRGLWLILLEVTVVRFCWYFDVAYGWLIVQVIWVIGAGFVLLAGALWLPRGLIAAVGLAMIFGHNLLDGIVVDTSSAAALPWMLLHQPGYCRVSGAPDVMVLYPLVPWVGVLLCGYVLGPVFTLDAASRRRMLATFGVAATLVFAALRWSNVYGDPQAWTPPASMTMTICSFLNCEKYPPSLQYLLMTLGPALIVLAWLDRPAGRFGRVLATFGRVPMFYYILHLALIHGLAVALSYIWYGQAEWYVGLRWSDAPDDYPSTLAHVYGGWLMVVVMLYPVCAWYAGYKKRHRNALTWLV